MVGAGEGLHRDGPTGMTWPMANEKHTCGKATPTVPRETNCPRNSRETCRIPPCVRASRPLLQGSQDTERSPVTTPWNLKGTNGQGEKAHHPHQDSGPGLPRSHRLRVRAGFFENQLPRAWLQQSSSRTKCEKLQQRCSNYTHFPQPLHMCWAFQVRKPQCCWRK